MKIFADAVENYYRRENPVNESINFIGPSPLVTFNSEGRFPTISPDAFIGPFSSIIGDVTIEDNVFIAPNVSIRADEGTPFFIGNNTNIQDGSVLHGLKEEWVVVNGERYSIYIGSGVTCAHGSIVHGPCVVGEGTFVGFKAMVFNAIIGKGSFISNNATVTGGVKIAPHRLVPIGALIDTQEKADSLELVPRDKEEFSKEVQDVNREFPLSYSI